MNNILNHQLENNKIQDLFNNSQNNNFINNKNNNYKHLKYIIY